jgi:Fic family protein
VYIYELPNWPRFSWDEKGLAKLISNVRYKQGKLIGKMESLGFSLKEEAELCTLTEDILKTSEIEGQVLDAHQVRSSLARRLGIKIGTPKPSDRNVDGIVDMMLDATKNFEMSLTQKRLFGWHAAIFPTGYSGTFKIKVGKWRDDSHGPMQVVSGAIGKERVHFEAPNAKKLNQEMSVFIRWFEGDSIDSVLKAGIAHLWFVTIHPFDDGNGRIARAISDIALARSDKVKQRFYSMSAQIQKERAAYYKILEQSQKGTLEITPWLNWFLECLERAIDNSENILVSVIYKSQFWQFISTSKIMLNERQRRVLNRLFDGFDGKLTSSKWAKLGKCSQDTALRDIEQMIELRILKKDAAGGRSTSYSLIKNVI